MTTPANAPALPLRLRVRRAARGVRRVLLARRRLLAAALAAVAVLAGVRAVEPAPPDTVEVLVAARDLAPGQPVSGADLRTHRVAADLVPPGAGSLADPAALLGRAVAGPVAAGELLTTSRLVGPDLAAGSPGRTTMPVRLADADAAGLLRTGDRVDLLAADLRAAPGAVATTLATGVDVLAVPAPGQSSALAGPTSSGGAGPPGRLVVVAVAPDEVARVSQATAAGSVTFTWADP